jgi:hypothetical protein
VDGQEDDAWARARLEVTGGDQEWSTAPAAEGTRRQSREQRRQEEEGGGIELGTILQYQRKIGTSLKRTCKFQTSAQMEMVQKAKVHGFSNSTTSP